MGSSRGVGNQKHPDARGSCVPPAEERGRRSGANISGAPPVVEGHSLALVGGHVAAPPTGSEALAVDLEALLTPYVEALALARLERLHQESIARYSKLVLPPVCNTGERVEEDVHGVCEECDEDHESGRPRR
jgi:hypothetical protein